MTLTFSVHLHDGDKPTELIQSEEVTVSVEDREAAALRFLYECADSHYGPSRWQALFVADEQYPYRAQSLLSNSYLYVISS